MSSAGEFSVVATSDKVRELEKANYFGNVNNHFSKMHLAKCLGNVVNLSPKLEDDNEVSQQKLSNYINYGTLTPSSTPGPNLFNDSDQICQSNLISPNGGGELKKVPLPTNDTTNIDSQPPTSQDVLCTLLPTKPNRETILLSESDSLHESSTQSHDAPTCLDFSCSSRADATMPLEENCDIGDEEVREGTESTRENATASVSENVPDVSGSGSKRESMSSSKNSLHVQFEERSCKENEGEAAANGEAPPARESPTFSLTSDDSSSEGDESSLEDLAEERAPDGGYGWVVVVAAFFTNLIADGISFTFGIIYVELLKHFKEAKSKTAWIGGTFMAMPLLSGPVASYLTDRFGCRKVCMFGAVLACIGFVISSQADSIEVLILSFGVLSGFGLAMCFVSAVVIVAYYFDKKRSLATGLSVCGSGLGTFVFAPISSKLIEEYGWRGTILIMAGLFLNIMVCGALMRDLEWTKQRIKAQRRDRKMKHRKKRSLRSQSQSLRTATSSIGSLNPSKNLSIEELKRVLRSGEKLIPVVDDSSESADDANRLCSSVVHLPTFLSNGEKVPMEVLELLSSNKQVYNVVLKNYPSFLIPTRSNSDVGYLNISPDKKPNFTVEDKYMTNGEIVPADELMLDGELPQTSGYIGDSASARQRFVTLPRSLLKHANVPRRSLTYRGAMLNFNQYRTRAASCPDISRNSMISIPQRSPQWYECFWDLRDVLADMVDITHFSDVRFLLFALSNFILYSWYDVPYVFIADKAVGMGFSESDASLLISILGIVNMFGEVLFGWMGDLPWVNAGLVYAMCMGACGVVTIMIPLVSSYIGLSIASGGFGLFISANYSLSSIILVELISLDRFTNAYGLLLFVQGTANLVGPPLAGWLYDMSGNYDLSFYLAGIFIIFCGFLLVILPTMKWCKRHKRLLRSGSQEATTIEEKGSSRRGRFFTEESERLPV